MTRFNDKYLVSHPHEKHCYYLTKYEMTNKTLDYLVMHVRNICHSTKEDRR